MAGPTHSREAGSGATAASRPPWRLTAADVLVEFTWGGDRWTHRVVPAAAADAAAAWASVEAAADGRDDPRWPASPVLVEMTRVATATGPVLVGVGLAGRSHFSATFAAEEAAAAIRVEVACRLHEQPAWLGSTYRSDGRIVRLEPAVAVGPLPRTVVWTYRIGRSGPVATEGCVARETTA
jgi:hypothetical protein